MSDEGQVRACAPYSYLNWCDEAASVVRDHIKQHGYRAVELATRRPSIRQGRLEEFMQGKGAHSGRSIAIFPENGSLQPCSDLAPHYMEVIYHERYGKFRPQTVVTRAGVVFFQQRWAAHQLAQERQAARAIAQAAQPRLHGI